MAIFKTKAVTAKALSKLTFRGIAFALLFSGSAFAQSPGLIDDFAQPGVNGWTSFNSNTNPGTGGVGGAGDGYLNIARVGTPFNFGSHNDGPNYVGNWTAGGITAASFYLNDVGSDQDFSFHFLVSGDESSPTGLTSWQFNTGFNPPNNEWQQYIIQLNDESNWTRIRGESSLAEVLVDVSDVHFRHDLEPYTTSPDTIAGDIGIDSITLVPEPATLGLLLGLCYPMLRRGRLKNILGQCAVR